MDEYKGINRESFPNWQGWKIIDDYRKMADDPKVLNHLCENNVQLQELVALFYQGGGK